MGVYLISAMALFMLVSIITHYSILKIQDRAKRARALAVINPSYNKRIAYWEKDSEYCASHALLAPCKEKKSAFQSDPEEFLFPRREKPTASRVSSPYK